MKGAKGQYRKLRAVACRYWAISPDELDQKCQAGLIKMPDVYDLVALLAADVKESIWIIPYLFPGQVKQAREEKRSQAQAQKATGILSLIKPQSEDEAKLKQELLKRMQEKVKK